MREKGGDGEACKNRYHTSIEKKGTETEKVKQLIARDTMIKING